MRDKMGLVITIICVVIGLILVLFGFGGKSNYAEKINDVKGRSDKSYDRILVNADNKEFAKVCKVSDEEYKIPVGYVLLETKDNKLQKIIDKEGTYKEVKKDCKYYYLEVKAHPFSCNSTINYKNEKGNYKLNFYIKIDNINSIFKNNEFFEFSDEEFFEKYMRKILEENVNRIMALEAEHTGNSIKAVDISILREELNKVTKNENAGFEFDIFRVTFE